MKKALRDTQTLRAGCSKAEPNIFAPPQTPFPEARDGQNLISWRWSLPLPTNSVWWESMHTISSYRGNETTNKHTHKHTNKPTHTHRQDRLHYTTLQLDSAHCNHKSYKLECQWVVVQRINENSTHYHTILSRPIDHVVVIRFCAVMPWK